MASVHQDEFHVLGSTTPSMHCPFAPPPARYVWIYILSEIHIIENYCIIVIIIIVVVYFIVPSATENMQGGKTAR